MEQRLGSVMKQHAPRIRRAFILLALIVVAATLVRGPFPMSQRLSGLLAGAIAFLVAYFGGHAILLFQIKNKFAPRSFARQITLLFFYFWSFAAVWFTCILLWSAAQDAFGSFIVLGSAGGALSALAVWNKHFATDTANPV